MFSSRDCFSYLSAPPQETLCINSNWKSLLSLLQSAHYLPLSFTVRLKLISLSVGAKLEDQMSLMEETTARKGFLPRNEPRVSVVL